MKIRGVLIAAVAALVLAAPASALRWLDEPPPPPPPGHTITPPPDATKEAVSADGALVNYDNATVDPPDESATCTPGSGSQFPIGTTTVTCTAGDANDAHFNVTVQDTTPPTIDAHSDVTDSTSTADKAVSYTAPDGHDAVGPVTVACLPGSGSSFAIGTTPVTCTATDGAGLQSQTQFNVIVSDTGAPAISVAAPLPTEATGPGGAVVNYTVNTSDNSGVTPSVDCGGHGPGSPFSLGTTHVTCTATDGASNHASTDFDVTVQDTTKPTLSLPSNIAVEADSAAGKAVTYSASASDLVSSVTPNCSPASGSTFPVGTTTVTCTATDAAGNSQSGGFNVTVTDASGPVFSSVPGAFNAEANGPTGSVVNYTTPTAVDTVDGPQLVSCSPASHTLFPLGSTTVQCTAADNHGNSSSASFQVAVVDTTPPTLAVPGPTTVYATTPAGIPETAPAFIAFRNAANADDIVDSHPTIGDNLGSFADVGTHGVGFFARDASGNVTAKATQLTVLPMPPAGTPPLPLPPPAKLPADVPSLQVFPGDGFVRLVWGAAPGAARYLVYRSVSGTRRFTADGHGDLVYSGTATTYTDRGLTNGVEYRYVVVSQDAAGNQSAGVGSPAVPRLNLLHAPKDGAKVKRPPKLTWARNAEANYYNVQLFRGQAKILSTWPVGASLKLKGTWKYQGRHYTLTNGVYRWYVWPGFGARSAVDYGELLGSNSFQMTR